MTVSPLNAGTPCPGTETQNCDVDCEFTWGPYAPDPCKVGDTNRTRTAAVAVPAVHSGEACPDPQTIPCDAVPCDFTWNDYGACNKTTGQKWRTTTIISEPISGGTPCPDSPDAKACTVHCDSAHTNWTTCDKRTGLQSRNVTVAVPPLNNGDECLLPEERACPVDCEHQWQDWSACNPTAGVQARTARIDVVPLNGGQGCPPPEEQNCTVDCVGTWGDWTECNKTTGKQQRAFAASVLPLNGGKACDTLAERNCTVDCEFVWGNWSTPCDRWKGTRTRSAVVLVVPKTGHDGIAGQTCPLPVTEQCDVDCLGYWEAWEVCAVADPKKPQGPFTRSRDHTIVVPKLNGGEECPTRQFEECIPDVCYSGDSLAPTFGPKIEGMRPIRTLPRGHPSTTRPASKCGGPLPEGAFVPASDCGLLRAGGANTFYALTPTAGANAKFGGFRTGTNFVDGKDGVSQFFFLQDTAGQLHWVLVNAPPVDKDLEARAKFSFEIKDQTIPFDANNLPGWIVKNDPELVQDASCSPSGGSDCYQWIYSRVKGEGRWMWGADETSGGVFGQLPPAGFCINLKIGDMVGIDSYEFADYTGENGANVSYKTAVPVPKKAFDYSLEMCAYFCPKTSPPVAPGTGIDLGGSGGGDAGGDGGAGGDLGGSGSGSKGSGDSGGVMVYDWWRQWWR